MVQHASVGDLIFDIPVLIEYISRFTPLSPGVERLQVQRNLLQQTTVGGFTYPAGPGPLETYRCEVGQTSGDWACVLIP